jgi:two-component system, OmpR family, phosphate regulon response regulator PhoB
MPSMTPCKTLLVTAPDPALARRVGIARPDLLVVALDARFGAPEPIEGNPLCFVDWLLPDSSGLELVKRLREARPTRTAHITMVLDEAGPDERRRALKAGADDYMIGPLSADALLDRVAQYERTDPSHARPRARLMNGPLSIDLAAHQVRINGKPIAMRRNEFRLLAHFMEHPDQVFNRSELIEQLGKEDEVIDERTVDVWVGRLRRTLSAHGSPDPLRTVRAIGYVMDSAAS